MTTVVTNPTVPSTGLFPDIFSAYSKLASHPVALALFIIAILSLVAEANNQNGPLEILQSTLKEFIDNKDKKHSEFLVTLATVIKSIIDLLIKFKKFFFLWLLIIVIPIVYPDRNTSFLVVCLLVYSLLTSHSYLVVFFIVQIFFVYYSLTEFSSQLIIFLLLIYCLFGTDNVATFFTPKPSKPTTKG